MIFTATIFIYHLGFCNKSCLFSLHLPPLPSFLPLKLKSWLSCIDHSSSQSPPEGKPKASYWLTNSCDHRGHALPPARPSSLAGRLAVPQHALALTLLQLCLRRPAWLTPSQPSNLCSHVTSCRGFPWPPYLKFSACSLSWNSLSPFPALFLPYTEIL